MQSIHIEWYCNNKLTDNLLRQEINKIVSRNFNHTIRNTYNTDKSRQKEVYRSPISNRTLEVDHYLEAAQSKFVLCPSGLGFDTYRLWETLMLGSIPIVESNRQATTTTTTTTTT